MEEIGDSVASDSRKVSGSQPCNIPKPPPPPLPRGFCRRLRDSNHALEGTRNAWDKLFFEGYRADVIVDAKDNATFPAHSCILGVSSPVLRSVLEQAATKEGLRRIEIPGVPSEAARVFVRFLYSSRYEEDSMKKYLLHVLMLAHAFSVPFLKRACVDRLEKGLLCRDNVIDVLQLALQCDVPRLAFICTRMIVEDFRMITMSEGWRAMKLSNASLEQELVESLVEADSRKIGRVKKKEEKKVYRQLYEGMEALAHACQDSCHRVACQFPSCEPVRSLLRHFSLCGSHVLPDRCPDCKRMRQLLELHSRICSVTGPCPVPLCRHFKEKAMENERSRREETKWNLLVWQVMASKGTLSSINFRRFMFP